MIRDFDAWSANFEELGDLHELSGCRVGIEAADYLNHRILNHPRAKEPLVPALGGLPLALRQHIEEDLDTFASLQIEPQFVFSGIDIAKPDDPFRQKQIEAATNAEAWNLYDNHQAEPAVDKFGQSSERRMNISGSEWKLTRSRIRHSRRPLSRTTVRSRRKKDIVRGRAVQCVGSGKDSSHLGRRGV